MSEMNVRQYLGWYQFKGGDQQKKVLQPGVE
jgi:hypothetical protein